MRIQNVKRVPEQSYVFVLVISSRLPKANLADEIFVPTSGLGY